MKKACHGSCHCGVVRYEADLDLAAGTGRCNCSNCAKTRSCGVTIKPQDFRLLGGEYVSINLACLDGVEPRELIDAPLRGCDGRANDWMNPSAETRHFSGHAMSKPVLNIDELEAIPLEVLNRQYGGNPMPAKFGGAMAPIGQRLGAQKLGYNLTVVPPGKRAFPFHSHRVNEEMFFVIEGAGEVRIGSETWPVRAGDVICCPPGGPETAHQIVNTGDATLRYLAVSSSQTPEICEYPDSRKFAVMHFASKDADGKPQGFRHAGRLSDGCDYWDGE